MPSPASRPSSARLGGLDGLRAIAVALVLVYHLFPGMLPGGFLGVDVFFVISGFLITTLLLREQRAEGRISLTDFWRRRARRLLPALGLVLLVSTSLALAVGGDLLVNIGKQIAGAALFVSNWVYVALGADYFARDNPELFRNTWSLAIEEQFYIILPLLLILLFRASRWQTRALLLGGMSAVSAVWMAVLSLQGADPTRIYFGSDTHTFGLLLGAAAAIALYRTGSSEPDRAPSTGMQIGSLVAAFSGLAVLAWLSLTLREASPESFQGGFQLASLAAIVVVIAITRSRVWVGRALDNPPMRWIGERSYGIYLWHWPLLLVFSAVFAFLPAWGIGILTLAVTVVLSTLSYRFVEQPVRKNGLISSLRRAASFRSETSRLRWVAVALAAILVVTVPVTGYAIAVAPGQSSSAEAIARGQAELERQQAEQAAEGAPEEAADPAAEHAGADDGAEKSEADGDKKKPTEPPPVPVVPTGGDISAIGDSVMLASLPELSALLPGISVDAGVSRSFGAGVGIAAQQADQGALRPVIVAGLGTNGPVDPADVEALYQLAAGRPLVLVNAYGERDWIPGVNQTLADFAAAHHGVVVADWQGSVAGVPDALAGDGIHPNTSGGEIYAASVQQALADLQTPGEAIGYGTPRR